MLVAGRCDHEKRPGRDFTHIVDTYKCRLLGQFLPEFGHYVRPVPCQDVLFCSAYGDQTFKHILVRWIGCGSKTETCAFRPTYQEHALGAALSDPTRDPPEVPGDVRRLQYARTRKTLKITASVEAVDVMAAGSEVSPAEMRFCAGLSKQHTCARHTSLGLRGIRLNMPDVQE